MPFEPTVVESVAVRVVIVLLTHALPTLSTVPLALVTTTWLAVHVELELVKLTTSEGAAVAVFV